MSEEEPVVPEQIEAPAVPEHDADARDMKRLACVSIACSGSAVVSLCIAIGIDSIALFSVVAGFSVLGVVTSFSQKYVQDPLKSFTVIGALFSGVLSLFSLAILAVRPFTCV